MERQERQWRERLERRLGDFSLKVALGSAPEEVAVELEAVGREAGEARLTDVAREAARIAESYAVAAEEERDALLARGIEALERALQAHGDSPAPVPEPARLSLAQDPELVTDFLVESREHLARVEAQLLALDEDPSNQEAIHAVFRGFHTIKGLAGFLEFATIQEAAHEVETLLDKVREGQRKLGPEVVDVILEGADFLTRALAGVEEALHGGSAAALAAPRALLDRVRLLASGGGAEAAPDEPTPAAAVRDGAGPAPASTPPSAAPAASPEPAASTPARGGGERTAAQSLRVDAAKLDYLMDMVGEMVIAQSLVEHAPSIATLNDVKVTRQLSQLARITGEVQRTAMALRMLPVGALFQRVARLVRDLARKGGKQVALETSGEDTELDKTVVEELADPLMHMVRNSLDHGLETPEERVAAGKPPTGKVKLGAYHQAGLIVVEIADDGRGLSRDRILRKARERGLVEDGSHLSNQEVFNLIFEPGFSTAEQVTEVSGRGVGMDVVRRHIEKLRGRIEIQSTPGAGTVFLLKVPLTLAIIDGLVVAVGEDRYIVPIFTVREMFRPAPEMLATIEGRSEMVNVRGRLLPMIRLARRFGVKPRNDDPCQSLCIVTENEHRSYVLVVDEMLGKQEVVIKSLGEMFKRIPGVVGGAILGDGRVGLILDMNALFADQRAA